MADATPNEHPAGNPSDAERRAALVARVRNERRAWAGVMLVLAGGLLAFAIALPPDPSGMGTHRQLGLAPCGALVATGMPCPTCGMTTAFSHTVRLQWIRAFVAQPSGFLLAILTLAAVPVSLYTLWRGEWPLAHRWPTLTPFRLTLLLIAWFVGGWAFKLAWGLATGTLPVR